MPYSFADKRVDLISPWALLLMVAAVLAMLALLLPRNSFLTHPQSIGKPDALSVAYLQALVRANPEDDEIRLLYAEHLAGVGRLAEAERQLRMIDAASIEDESRLTFVELRLALLRLLKQPESVRLRRQAEQAIRRMLSLPQDAISVRRWREVADVLLQNGMPEWAARVYLRLALMDQEDVRRWLAEAVRWYLAAGLGEMAANVQLRLARMDGDIRQAEKAIDYLLAANKPRRALEVCQEFIQRFPEERGLLLKGIGVALAGGMHASARRWALDWLTRHPDDVAVMRKLIQIELAAGDPDAAYPWAERMVARAPSVIAHHAWLARIAEWTGHLETAYRERRWLVEHRRKHHDLRRALALAQALHDYPAMKQLLAREASEYGLNARQLADLAAVLEKLGEPRESVLTRLAYLKLAPNDRKAWEELAATLEYVGDLTKAEATWAKIEHRFGRDETTVVQRARLLSAMDRLEEGLKILRDYAQRKEPGTEQFWRLYGDLAWNLEYQPDAFRAYRWLWEHRASGSLEAQRLIILLREEGDAVLTLRISEQAWRRFHDPEVLLLAIESALRMRRWADVDRLLKIAEARPADFHQRRRYWLLHAQWAWRQNRLDTAEHDYRRALRLLPQDAEARNGLLWIWIQTHQHRKLRRYLLAWRRDAVRDPAYWQAYAAAYRELNQPRAALPWFAKYLRAHRDDLLWMLEYADALADAGRADAAWRLRRYLFTKLWPQGRPGPAYAQHNEMATMEALAGLNRRLQGLPQAFRWLRVVLRHRDDPVVREFAMRWYLDAQPLKQAGYWLLTRHARRMQTPAWQRMAIAMERNDLDQIQRLLAGDDRFDHGTMLLAYRQLHRLDQAWNLAMDPGLGTGQFRPIEQTTMLRHARDLDASLPNAAHLGFSLDRFGGLNMSRWGGKWFSSRDNHILFLNGGVARLDTEAGFGNLAGGDREYELQLGTGFSFRHGEAMAYLGENRRSRGRIDAGRLWQWGGSLKWRPWQGGETAVALALRETSLETPAFRLIGARDRLRLSLNSDISNREYLSLHGSLNRFHSRRGEPIGRGYALEMVLGERLQLADSLAEEQIHARLSGELVGNRLAPQLAPWVRRILPGATVSSVVPRRFVSIGVGLNIQRDHPGNDEAVARSPSYLIDAWIGWQWPASVPVYSLSLGVGFPVLGRDMLSLRADVANSNFGGISNEARYGVALWYSHRFGR